MMLVLIVWRSRVDDLFCFFFFLGCSFFSFSLSPVYFLGGTFWDNGYKFTTTGSRMYKSCFGVSFFSLSLVVHGVGVYHSPIRHRQAPPLHRLIDAVPFGMAWFQAVGLLGLFKLMIGVFIKFTSNWHEICVTDTVHTAVDIGCLESCVLVQGIVAHTLKWDY
jgi:vacuolar-type H+-ATPase subunit I/STV1